MFRIDRASVDLSADPARINLLEVKPTPAEMENVHKLQAEPEVTPIDIIERANQESVVIIQRAQQEAARIKQDAEINGYAQGKAEAEADFAEAERQQATAFDAMVQRIQREHEEMAHQANIAAVKLAMDIAEKILSLELDRNDEAFLSVAQEAVDRINGEGKITLRVSPMEYRRFFTDGSLAGIVCERKLAVIEDGRLEEGGCVVETDEETVDASVGEQLSRISETFGLTDKNDNRPY